MVCNMSYGDPLAAVVLIGGSKSSAKGWPNLTTTFGSCLQFCLIFLFLRFPLYLVITRFCSLLSIILMILFLFSFSPILILNYIIDIEYSVQYCSAGAVSAVSGGAQPNALTVGPINSIANEFTLLY